MAKEEIAWLAKEENAPIKTLRSSFESKQKALLYYKPHWRNSCLDEIETACCLLTFLLDFVNCKEQRKSSTAVKAAVVKGFCKYFN